MIIKNGNIICDNQIKYAADLHICENVIAQEQSDGEIIDATGLYVCPGFVDIHTHGGFGGDFMDVTDEAFENALPNTGYLSFSRLSKVINHQLISVLCLQKK